jgi:hypothetical protein
MGTPAHDPQIALPEIALVAILMMDNSPTANSTTNHLRCHRPMDQLSVVLPSGVAFPVFEEFSQTPHLVTCCAFSIH